MPLTAVLLNDTRGDSHFGCFRVMRAIEENLKSRGITVSGRSLVRSDWHKNRSFLDAMSRCDIVVINGEGTLHHGSPQGEKLLRVVDHPARGQKPVVLINTIYQENPASWGRYLAKMALISTRDSWSAQAAAPQAGHPVGFVPDLSLSYGFAETVGHTERSAVLIGDSVSRTTSKALVDIAASTPGARLLPITRTIKSSKPHFPAPLRALREAYIRMHAAAFRWSHPNVWFNRDEHGFIKALQHGRLHVTGRFHAVCLCLVTRTPFLATESNSWKIEALLHDLDLGTERLTDIGQLGARLSDIDRLAYSAAEDKKLAEGMLMCTRATKMLFDQIRTVASSA